MNKVGLVLEGGAMRGMFTCGVLDVIMENKVKFDTVIGVSAGAAFGCNYKSNQIGRAIRYNKKYCKDPRYGGFKSLIKTGDYYNAKFAYHDVPFIYDKFDTISYRNHPSKFIAVATDVETGMPVYKELVSGDERDIDFIRASASMPLFSKPVEIDGRSLLDGGISDSIPLKWMVENETDINVVVLTQPEGFVKPAANPKAVNTLVKKYPAIRDAMIDRHNMYNETIEYIKSSESAGKTFVIMPECDLNISRTCNDAEELERVYQLGRSVMSEKLNDLKLFLQKNTQC